MKKHTDNPRLISYTIGWDENGNPIVWNRSFAPHALLASDTTHKADIFVTRIAKKALDSQQELVYAIDPKSSNVATLATKENKTVLKVASTVSDSLELMKSIQDEMMKRYAYCEEKNLYNFLDDENGFLSSLVFVTDDGGIFENEEISEFVNNIARLGRAVGINLLVNISDIESSLSGNTKANLGLRIQLGECKQDENIALIRSEDEEKFLEEMNAHLKKENAAVISQYSESEKSYTTEPATN